MSVSEDDFLLGKDKLINLKLTVPFILPRSRDIFQKFEGKSVENTVEPLGSDTSLIRTPLYYGQFPISRKNSHIFYLKKTSTIRTLANTDNEH